MTQTNAIMLVYSPELTNLSTIEVEENVRIRKTASLKRSPPTLLPMLTRADYDKPSAEQAFLRPHDERTAHKRVCIMVHSSGTTGLPHPVKMTNAGLLSVARKARGLVAFQTAPFTHGYGIGTYSQAIWARKTIYLFNARKPQTYETVSRAMQAAKPEVVYTVPYTLKLLAGGKLGIELMKDCRYVCVGGSQCPDDLGDSLVKQGVFLGSIFARYVLIDACP